VIYIQLLPDALILSFVRMYGGAGSLLYGAGSSPPLIKKRKERKKG
jgi:hypothetical protein